MPEISVIIPTWNRLPLLLEAVASVRAQTFRDWELIVVDDGSTDGTAKSIGALGDSRIRLLQRPRTGNVAELRNAGIAAARSELIAFLDSDDLCEPTRLQVQRAAMRAAGAAWSYTGYTLIDERGRPAAFPQRSSEPSSGDVLRDLLTGAAGVTICTVMSTRVLLDTIGGFDPESGREDYDMLLRLAAQAPAVVVPESLVRVREHAGRSTAALRSPFEVSVRPFTRLLERERDPELRRIARRRCAELLMHGAVHAATKREPGRAVRLLARSLRFRPAAALWVRAAAAMLVRLLGIRR